MRADLREQALAVLRHDEGEREYAYDDATGKRVRAPEGNLTIGIGTDLDAGLDATERVWLEDHRLEREWHALMGHFVEHGMYLALLPDPAQLALALMAYQLGADKVMHFPKMLVAVKNGRWKTAAAEATDSEWAQQSPPRAARVAALLRSCGGE